jgi:hypothetical protein
MIGNRFTTFFVGDGFVIVVYADVRGQLLISWIRSWAKRCCDGRHAWTVVPVRK